jgi:hypothetical protein
LITEEHEKRIEVERRDELKSLVTRGIQETRYTLIIVHQAHRYIKFLQSRRQKDHALGSLQS